MDGLLVMIIAMVVIISIWKSSEGDLGIGPEWFETDEKVYKVKSQHQEDDAGLFLYLNEEFKED